MLPLLSSLHANPLLSAWPLRTWSLCHGMRPALVLHLTMTDVAEDHCMTSHPRQSFVVCMAPMYMCAAMCHFASV